LFAVAGWEIDTKSGTRADAAEKQILPRMENEVEKGEVAMLASYRYSPFGRFLGYLKISGCHSPSGMLRKMSLVTIVARYRPASDFVVWIFWKYLGTLPSLLSRHFWSSSESCGYLEGEG
jgi:hypothetical protein